MLVRSVPLIAVTICAVSAARSALFIIIIVAPTHGDHDAHRDEELEQREARFSAPGAIDEACVSGHYEYEET